MQSSPEVELDRQGTHSGEEEWSRLSGSGRVALISTFAGSQAARSVLSTWYQPECPKQGNMGCAGHDWRFPSFRAPMTVSR